MDTFEVIKKALAERIRTRPIDKLTFTTAANDLAAIALKALQDELPPDAIITISPDGKLGALVPGRHHHNEWSDFPGESKWHTVPLYRNVTI